jgi:hypothetical protein
MLIQRQTNSHSNNNEQHTDCIFCHTDKTVQSSNLQSPNRNKCEQQQLEEKNVHLNCPGNASQFQFAVSIPTAHLSHATTECAESLITLNEKAVLPVIQYVLQTSSKCEHFYYTQFTITFHFILCIPQKTKRVRSANRTNSKTFSYHYGEQTYTV